MIRDRNINTMLENEAYELENDGYEVIRMGESDGSQKNNEEGSEDVHMIEAFPNGNKSNYFSKNIYPYLTSALYSSTVCFNYCCAQS